ncbi:bursicon [Elysia marginata]|uniref:Bursicon n=1 Tax=Elysia marginata TaxID=1093978 RepID=A0AAV4HZS5_9GAST|nr:bursicon [Elysia marginata]
MEDSRIQYPLQDVERENPEEGYTQICNTFYVASSYIHRVPKKTCTPCSTDSGRSHWTLKNVTVLNISLVLLLALLPQGQVGACSLRRSVHTVRFRQCIPKRVLSLNCHGTCNSYSSLNPADLLSIIRNCNCCKETGFANAWIPLRCPKPNGERGYRDAHIRVKVPRGCSCRPCDPLPTIQAGEYL